MYRYADEKQKSAIGTIVVLLLFVFLLNGYGWAGRVDTPINDQWRFYRADAANAQLPSFDDSAQGLVNLPHTYNALDGQDGVSSGTTTGLEEFDFPNTSARYLRIIANGNSTGDWNSYYEVEIYGVIDCDFIIKAGCGLTSDWGGPNNVSDCHVDFYDFAVMCSGWLTSFDITDLAVLAIQWLQCNDPQNPDCGF